MTIARVTAAEGTVGIARRTGKRAVVLTGYLLERACGWCCRRLDEEDLAELL